MNWRVDFPVLLKGDRNMPDASHDTLGALAQNFIMILIPRILYSRKIVVLRYVLAFSRRPLTWQYNYLCRLKFQIFLFFWNTKCKIIHL